MNTQTTATTNPAIATSAPGYQWSDALLTGDARMDDTHHEFAQQLDTLLATPQADQLPLYQAFVAHTVAHFAQEDRWMLATGFTASNCHTDQHNMILETMQAVVQHYQKGETDIINRMGEALAECCPPQQADAIMQHIRAKRDAAAKLVPEIRRSMT